MIIGISGFIGSGKDTVANYLVDNYGFEKDSFATTLKDIVAILFSWPRDLLEGNTKESRLWREQVDHWWAKELGIDNFTPRYALQLLGTNVLRKHFNEDIWLLTLKRRMENRKIIISDARFPNELHFIKKLGGKLIEVDGNVNPTWLNDFNNYSLEIFKIMHPDVHESEYAWIRILKDYVVTNHGTFEDLYTQLDKIFKN